MGSLLMSEQNKRFRIVGTALEPIDELDAAETQADSTAEKKPAKTKQAPQPATETATNNEDVSNADNSN
jgi:hypothetical protein